MKIDYLHEGSTDCPLIRLYEYQKNEIVELQRIVSDLAKGKRISFDLDRLNFIFSVENCSLSFIVNEKDDGIDTSANLSFTCRLSTDGWAQMAGLLSPFPNKIDGYQWLDENGKVSLLISPDGRW